MYKAQVLVLLSGCVRSSLPVQLPVVVSGLECSNVIVQTAQTPEAANVRHTDTNRKLSVFLIFLLLVYPLKRRTCKLGRRL